MGMDSNLVHQGSPTNSEGETNFPHDVMRLIFDQLAGDYDSLSNVSLTCHLWCSLSLPSLLRVVDLSSHNDGRLPERELPPVAPVLYADFNSAFRPRNLVPRQRAFLRLMTSRSDLAKHVKSLTWTLIWKDFDETVLTETGRQTWNVFSRMTNVSRLDLALINEEICEEAFVRENPSILFPAVTDLRLLGWMHRGLVKAIITSLDSSRLHRLKLDYLTDEGALPDGAPWFADAAQEYAQHARRTNRSDLVDDELLHRQETGEACIFPGPMWLPLRLLSGSSLGSLTHLEIRLAPFSMDIDLRSYHTMFDETAKLMLKVKQSLRSLVVVFGEDRQMYEETRYISQCGNGRSAELKDRPWAIRMAASFLSRCLTALNQGQFNCLEHFSFEGFHILETADAEEAASARLVGVFQSIRDCPFSKASFTDISSVDYRFVFQGYV